MFESTYKSGGNMAFIVTRTNLKIDHEQETLLKRCLGKAVGHLEGEKEAGLALEFHTGSHLYMAGRNDKPITIITVDTVSGKGFEAFAEEVRRAYAEILKIDPVRIYINFRTVSESLLS
jgi:hypothetical protein